VLIMIDTAKNTYRKSQRISDVPSLDLKGKSDILFHSDMSICFVIFYSVVESN